MGTEARIVVYASDSSVAAAAATAAFARIAEIDRDLSDYRVDGTVARIAAAPAGHAVAVSRDLAVVLSHALTLAAQTDGAFDPAAGAVVRLWREARRSGALPDPVRVRVARAHGGWRNVAVDTVARTVRPAVAGLWLDLGAIAKGWAADEALAVLRTNGVDRALLELGGEIVAGEPPPGADGWRVAVGSAAQDTTLLARGALSTSGPAEQFVEIDGVRYSHVLDPRTGVSLTNGRSATVHAPSGWLADALATAATVLDSAGLDRLARAYPVAAITVW